jgi:hypothetical protein
MLFLLWALKDSLGSVESTIDDSGNGMYPSQYQAVPEPKFSRAEHVAEPIGSYQGAQIFQFARIDGKDYQFEHVCGAAPPALRKTQRCLPPGLIYEEC